MSVDEKKRSEKKGSAPREFRVLDDREHILLRSGMYIGGTKLAGREHWILDPATGKMARQKLASVPGLLKICSEIVDNSVDAAIDAGFSKGTHVEVEVGPASVRVADDGVGIPVEKLSPEDGRTLPEIAWTTLRSGTSFGGDREKAGTNGLGSVATNVFSKKFVAVSDDGKKRQTIHCLDNMAKIEAGRIEKSSGKSGCCVEFEPDLARFGLSEIGETHAKLIRQRLVGLAMAYPKMRFKFNGEKISVSVSDLGKLFADAAVSEVEPGVAVCVFPSSSGEFEHYSSVNGLDTFRGGSHVDYVAGELAGRIRDKMEKKLKGLKPADVKRRLGLAVVLTGFKNPEFGSQSKETLDSSVSDVAAHLAGKIDFAKLAKRVLDC